MVSYYTILYYFTVVLSKVDSEAKLSLGEFKIGDLIIISVCKFESSLKLNMRRNFISSSAILSCS